MRIFREQPLKERNPMTASCLVDSFQVPKVLSHRSSFNYRGHCPERINEWPGGDGGADK